VTAPEDMTALRAIRNPEKNRQWTVVVIGQGDCKADIRKQK
jgi:hypothetical protein